MKRDFGREFNDIDVALWIILAAVAALLLCILLTGCSSRRVARTPEVPDYDELSDPTPTQADLDQAVRDALAEIKARHQKER